MIGHRIDDLTPDQDVSLDRVVAPLAAPGPLAILLAGMRGGAALHVDHAELAALAGFVFGEQPLDRLLRFHAFFEQVEPLPAVLDNRRGLRRDRADTRAHPWHRAADERHARGDDHAGLAGLRIDRAQGKGRVSGGRRRAKREQE